MKFQLKKCILGAVNCIGKQCFPWVIDCRNFQPYILIDKAAFLQHMGYVQPLIFSAFDVFMNENSAREYVFNTENCMGQQGF